MSVFVLLDTVLSTFRTDESYFKFSPNSPLAISTDKIIEDITYKRNVNMYERLDSHIERS